MDPLPASIRQPFGLTDEEWIAVLRAHGQTYWQYVFGSFHLVYACSAVCLGTLPFCLGWDRVGAMHFHVDAPTLHGLGKGWLGVTAAVVGKRSLDWWGKRRTARAAGR